MYQGEGFNENSRPFKRMSLGTTKQISWNGKKRTPPLSRTGKTREDISVNITGDVAKRYYSPREKPYYWLDFGNSKKTGQVVLGTSRDND